MGIREIAGTVQMRPFERSNALMQEYHQAWEAYDEKNNDLEPVLVHSDVPVIRKVFQFGDLPLFRSRIIQGDLRGFEPYSLGGKSYVNPLWHPMHLMIVGEQMYHAATSIFRNDRRLSPRDKSYRSTFLEPINWKENVSVELTIKSINEAQRSFNEAADYVFYDDKNNRVLATSRLLFHVQPRSFIDSFDRLKEGDEKAKDLLIRQIDGFLENKKRLSERKNGHEREGLVKSIQEGSVRLEDLEEFFSYW